MGEQGRRLLGSETRNVIECAAPLPCRPALTVQSNRRSVRLIPNPLQEIQRFAGPREDDGICRLWRPHLFEPLGQPNNGDIANTALRQGLLGSSDLWCTAVNDEQPRRIRKGLRAAFLTPGFALALHIRSIVGLRLRLLHSCEATLHHLANRCKIVCSLGPNDEGSVVALARKTVFEHNE